MKQKEFIEAFRKSKFGLDAEGKPSHINPDLLSDMEQLLKTVSLDVYSDDVHFIYELIQNAQDNSYPSNAKPTLKFILLDTDPTFSEGSEGCLCVINNEVGFNEEDIKSICSAGKSTKKQKKGIEGYIGEKGIGFKSVFNVSSNPHIYSNGFHIRFTGKDELTKLSFIIPYWANEAPEIVKENISSTCILLPLMPKKYSQIDSALKSHEPEISLFLSKLKRIEISVPSECYSACFESVINKNVTTLCVEVNEKISESRYWLSSKEIDVPDNINEEKREGVKNRTIMAAYPLDKQDISHNVFAYLPTKMNAGLPFIVNADFLMVSNRESINQSDWNQWLLSELGFSIAEDIEEMAESQLVGHKALGFVPLPQTVKAANPIFAELASNAIDALKNAEFLFCRDSRRRLPARVRRVDPEFRDLFKDCYIENDEFHWVHQELTPYEQQLRILDVRRIGTEEKLKYLYNSVWIKARDVDWFLKLYRYVFDSKKSQLSRNRVDDIPIIPMSSGVLLNPSHDEIFKPEKNANNLIPDGKLFPRLHIIQKSLFEKIIKDNVLYALFNEHVQISEFSIEAYFDNVLVQFVKDEGDQASLDEKKAVVEYVINHWGELGYTSENSDCVAIPVLLESENFYFNDEERELSLIVPRGMNAKTGWTKVFTKNEELRVAMPLHETYLELDRENFSSFAEALDIGFYPAPEICRQEKQCNLGGHYKMFDKAINQLYFTNGEYAYAGLKAGEFHLLPEIFWSLDSKNINYRTAFLAFLETCFDEDSLPRYSSGFEPYDFECEEDEFDSPFYERLHNYPWLKTTDGYRKPAECFVDDENVRLILGNSVPYVVDPLSDNLLRALGIHRTATTDALIEHLVSLSNSPRCDKSKLTRLYAELAERKEKLQSEFSKNSIIFVPGNPDRWCSLSEVIWEDDSDIASEVFVSLEAHYPNLREFFIEKLGVQECLDAKNYAVAWLKLQADTPPPEKVEKLYPKLFTKLRSEVQRDSSQDWLQDFFKSALVYSDKGRWISAHSENQPFLPDDEALRRAFHKKIPFVYRVESNSYSWMSVLTDCLDVEKLSEVCEYTLVNGGVRSSHSEANKVLTLHTCMMICHAIGNRGSEGVDRLTSLLSDGRINVLFSLKEQRIRNLRIKAQISHTDHAVILPDEPVFVDFAGGFLYIDSAAESDDVGDAVAIQIAKYLLARVGQFSDYEDTFRRYLGIETEKAYRKHLAKKSNWKLPRDVEEKLDHLVKINEYQPLAVSEPLLPSSPANSDSNDIQFSSTSEDPLNKLGVSSISAPQKAGVPRISARSETTSSSSSKTSPSSSPRSGGVLRAGTSKSASATSAINRARRDMMRSFVAPDLPNETDKDAEQKKQEIRDKLGERAEIEVLKDLQSRGFVAERMPPRNQGYDIQATNAEIGEVFFFEVKGQALDWGEGGVGITAPQYQFGADNGHAFYLAVVERVSSGVGTIYYIQDPIGKITQHRFDDGWKQLSQPLPSISAERSSNSPAETLYGLTNCTKCHEIIEYCEANRFPLPDAGLELINDLGEVVFECEFGWDIERIAIVLQEEDRESGNDVDNSWEYFVSSELAQIKNRLNEAFGSDLGCEL